MRRCEAPSTVYTVEISPPAWNQLAHLRVETYRRIRDALDAVAAALSQTQEHIPPQPVKPEGGYGASLPSVVVDDAIALYEVDHQRRCVLLLEVARRLPRGP